MLFAGLVDGSLRFQGQHLAALFGYLLPAVAQSDGLQQAASRLWLARPAPQE